MRRWMALALTTLLLTGCAGMQTQSPQDPPGEPAVQTPPTQLERFRESLRDGTLSAAEGVYDISDYEHLMEIWNIDEAQTASGFCGTWYGQVADETGETTALSLTLDSLGQAEYWYIPPHAQQASSFRGSWKEADGVLTLEMTGDPIRREEGPGQADDTLSGRFQWDCRGRELLLTHREGDSLLHAAEGRTFSLLPFDIFWLAGNWTAQSRHQDLIYDLALLSNGESSLAVCRQGEQLVVYAGWWSVEEEYLTLSLRHTSGQHPENPEVECLSGLYLAWRDGDVLTLDFDAGSILTLNMEEDGFEVFRRYQPGEDIRVRYALEEEWEEEHIDWVAVDEDSPQVAALLSVPRTVDDLRVLSLTWQEDGTWSAQEVYHHGELIPERPLVVFMTIYGDFPSYAVSYRDSADEVHTLAVGISGEDGSLVLWELG